MPLSSFLFIITTASIVDKWSVIVTGCYGLKVCVFQRSCVEILTSKHDGSRRRGFWEVLTSWGGALVGGVSALLQ